MGTPGLLAMLREKFRISGDRPGDGLIDHPMGFVGKARFKKAFSAQALRLASADFQNVVARSPIRLRSRCGHFVACVFLRPSLSRSHRLEIHKYKSLLGASAGWNRLRHLLDVRLLHPDILAEIFAHVTGVTPRTRTYSLLFIGEQKRGGNRVFWDHRGLVVDWSVSGTELKAYGGMIQDLGDLLAPVTDHLALTKKPTNQWLWSCAHHSGTTSLGRSETSVVDLDLRVHGTTNVFVCDASVLQEHSYANTGLTIAQLGLRLAAHLRDSLA